MKKIFAILLLFLVIFSNDAMAQFRKPLQSASNRVNPNEAKYNIGLIGGVTMTQWVHFGGTKTPYSHTFNFGPTAGLAVERMLNKTTSVSLEGLFAMRNTQLNYDVTNFPTDLFQNDDFYRQYNADYQEVNVQVPVTFYLGNGTIRPYVFVGPRFSMPLSGKMIWKKTKIVGYGTTEQHYDETQTTIDTVEMNAQNFRSWNVGIVAGAGVLFKLNMNNYYFVLKLDASAHAALINSFTKEEITGEMTNVVGAAYIDPYLLGMRFNTDATVKVTFMFPLKKQLQGACMKWGEYD